MNHSAADNLRLHGTDRPLQSFQSVRAGRITAELDGPDLRYLHFGDREIVRRIYVAVRDAEWGTVPVDVSVTNIDILDDRFEIRFAATNSQGGIDFSWTGRIAGSSDGRITYSMDGVANSTFMRNRIGICVLHPDAELAGARARIEHPDGSRSDGVFPELISPHQPFFRYRRYRA